MGSVTALMFADRDPTIGCLILDSPFTRLRQLARELVESAQLNIPKFAVGIGLRFVRSSVKSRAGFDINDLEPIKYAPNCHMPALFAAAKNDEFIRPHHAQEIYNQYAGDKNIITFEGDHNSQRPDFFHASVLIFIVNTLVTPCEQALKDLENIKQKSESKNNTTSTKSTQQKSDLNQNSDEQQIAQDPWNGSLFVFPAPMAASNNSSAGIVRPLQNSSTTNETHQTVSDFSRLQRFNVNGSSRLSISSTDEKLYGPSSLKLHEEEEDDDCNDYDNVDDLGVNDEDDLELMKAIQMSLAAEQKKNKQ